jgi:hypothetical protein
MTFPTTRIFISPSVQAPDVAQARIAKEMEWYTKLTQLDPRRKGYYEDQIASLKTII